MTVQRPWPAALLALAAACDARHDIGAERFTQTLSRDVDVLFVIDDSNRVGESASTVASALPAFAGALVASATSTHIGFITSEMPGPVSLQCTASQAGAFATNPQCLDDPFVSLEGGVPNFTGTLADALTCLYPPRTGCALLQPFAAVRAALDPTSGKAPPGFLRKSADLVVVFVATQDDCSLAPGSDLFGSPDGGADAGPATAAIDITYRCAAAGIMCGYKPLPATLPASPVTLSMCESSEDPRLVTVADTAKFLEQLKDDPKQVFVVVVGGPTAPFTIGPLAGVAATLQPSCQGNGIAVLPPVRIQGLADKLHGNGFAISLCGDLPSQLADVAASVSSRGKCLSGQPRFGSALGDAGADGGAGVPLCDVRLTAGTDAGAVSTQIPSCTTGDAPCFWVVANAAACPASGWQIDVKAGQAPLPSGSLEVDCLGLPSRE